MTEDWAAVARAINERVNELGIRQRDLAERSHVSQAIVRELQRNTVARRRSARTLEALSAALEWHPGHLLAVLHGNRPLRPGETGDPIDALAVRLDAIEGRLKEMTDQLGELNDRLATVARERGRARP